jgi:ABC-type glutathione transport system ATPase component
MPSDVLRAVGLTKVYRGQNSGTGARASISALHDVSFGLGDGEALGVVGESGSGKSTLARLLVGLDTPTSGSVEIRGVARSNKRTREQAKQVQMVFQDPNTSLDPRQTGIRALCEVLRFHFGRSRTHEATATALADEVGLSEASLHKRPSALSGGQRQRLAIARALAVRPEVVIFDEAVSALDVSVQAQVLSVIQRLREEHGMSYIFVTHDLAVARVITDRLLVMRQGAVVEEGATHEILARPQHAYTQRLRAAVPGPDWRPLVLDPTQ